MDLRKENRKRDIIKKLLTDAVVSLCRSETECHSVLLIEGTICITSDTNSVQVVQIQEVVNKVGTYRCDPSALDDLDKRKSRDALSVETEKNFMQPLTINTMANINQGGGSISGSSSGPSSANTFHITPNGPQFPSPTDHIPSVQIRELLTRAAVPQMIQHRPIQNIMHSLKNRRPMVGPMVFENLPRNMAPLYANGMRGNHVAMQGLHHPQSRLQTSAPIMQPINCSDNEFSGVHFTPPKRPHLDTSGSSMSAPTTPSNGQVTPYSRPLRASLSPEKLGLSGHSPPQNSSNSEDGILNLAKKVKPEPIDEENYGKSNGEESNNIERPSPIYQNGPPSSQNQTELNNNQENFQLEDGTLNLSKRASRDTSPVQNGSIGPPIFPGMTSGDFGQSAVVSKKLNQTIEVLRQKLTSKKSSNDNQGDSISSESSGSEGPSPNGEVYNCGICGDPYTDPVALEKHYFSHEAAHTSLLQSPHAGEGDLGISSIPYFMCEYCNKKFRFQSRYNEHVRMHTKEKPFPCLVCHKSFSYKGDLAKHMAVHSYPKPYNCQQCGAGFSFSGSLHKHMLKVHNIKHVPKPRSDFQVTKCYQYECHICHKRFKFQSLLERHLVIHENAGSETMGVAHYQCEYCFKRFRFRSTFIEHLRSHTKERPFTCQHCQKTFGYKADLQKHLRAKHCELSQDDQYPDSVDDASPNTEEPSLSPVNSARMVSPVLSSSVPPIALTHQIPVGPSAT